MRMLAVTVAAAVLAGCGSGDVQTFGGNPVLILPDPDAGTFSVTAWGSDERGVIATSGFIRPAPVGAVSTAGYLNLQSAGDDALIGASAPGFGTVELHEVTETDGISRMRRVERIVLMDGEAVRLEPGGYHLMMMAPTEVLSEGEVVPVALSFESGIELTIELPVAPGPAGGGGTAHDSMGH